MSRHLRIGVALGGGGARGLAHIAMLEAFDELESSRTGLPARAWARSWAPPMPRACARATSGNMRR